MSITAFALCTLAFAQQGAEPIATINGETITPQNYYRRMEYLPGLGRMSVTGQFVEVMPAISTLDAMVTETLVLQIAKSKGLIPSDSEIDKEIAYRVRSNSNLVKEWQATGRTMAELRHQIKVDRAQFKIQTEGIFVTDDDIKTNYDAAKATRFTVPERVKLRVITVRDEDSKSKVDAGIKAGQSFGLLASQYSTDVSKASNGEFGVVPIELLGDQVKTAVKALKPNERTDWLSFDGVFAKFELVQNLPQSLVPLDESVKEDLRREIMFRKGSTKVDLNKMIREARQKAAIKISSPDIDRLYKQFVDLEKQNKANGG